MDDAARREANKKLLREHFSGGGDTSDFDPAPRLARFADDLKFAMPQMGHSFEGIDGFAAAMSSVPRNFSFFRQTNVQIHDCLDPDEFIVEADADAVFRHSGERYDQHYVLLLRLRDGKISHYTEYVNTDLLAGFPPQPVPAE